MIVGWGHHMEQIKDFVTAFKNHDYTTFDRFYELTKKKVFFAIIAIVRDEDAASDIMQEAYMSFLNHIDQVEPTRNVIAYLTTIARHLAINQYNKDKRIVWSDELVQSVPSAEEVNQDDDIFRLLDVLPQDQREIVVMHVINDMTFRDIALVMEKPLGTVLWLYHKALKTMKVQLGDDL
jgi:RNA polymerase sigma-70 factor, ECF subfamily